MRGRLLEASVIRGLGILSTGRHCIGRGQVELVDVVVGWPSFTDRSHGVLADEVVGDLLGEVACGVGILVLTATRVHRAGPILGSGGEDACAGGRRVVDGLRRGWDTAAVIRAVRQYLQ